MSNAEADRGLVLPQGEADLTPTFERLEPRSVLLGPRTEVRRSAAQQGAPDDRRLVFVDHYGPEDISNAAGMRVAPHPHTGLQTVGSAARRRDPPPRHARERRARRAGSAQPDDVGCRIAHSRSRHGDIRRSCGVQLVGRAAQIRTRHEAPRDFTQYADLPRPERPGLTAIIIGQLEDQVPGHGVLALGRRRARGERERAGRAAARLRVRPAGDRRRPGRGGRRLAVSEIGYVGAGRDSLRLTTTGAPARGLLLGGEPGAEP